MGGSDRECDYTQGYKAFVWRFVFGFASLMAASGWFCRYQIMKDEEEPTGERREFQWGLVPAYMRPIIGAGIGWFMYDFVEYGLKQNDASLFSGPATYYNGNLVFLTRISCIPSLILATVILQWITTKLSQTIGFIGCGVVTLILCVQYTNLHENKAVINTLYMVQYSFQMFMGVTTMAIAAQVFPTKFSGTGAGIAAALGKVGATIGTYLFTYWKNQGKFPLIFGVTSVCCTIGIAITFVFVPGYRAEKLAVMQRLSDADRHSEAAAILYKADVSSAEKTLDIEQPLDKDRQ